MFLEIAAGLTVLALVLALTVPNLGSRWFEAIERNFGKLAKRRGLSVVTVGLTALALRAALLPILPIPTPGGYDEFCYLLLSDTFAHGRLTNPTSPMWTHFESFHIIWHPTYTAQYYPAQGLIMALGQVITSKPFWGIWLSVGLMCAAITWMLQGWLEPGWALLGGFLAVIRIGTFSYWANSYFGGAVAAIGGALVLGALPRLKNQRQVRHALLMGLGFAIIANSRPYEGLFFGIPIAAAVLLWLWKLKRPEFTFTLKRAVLPVLAVLAMTIIGMGYYFWRTTGTPFNTPYFVYEHTYNPVPYFPWQPLRQVPHYRYEGFYKYYVGYMLPQYRQAQTAMGTIAMKTVNLAYFWAFFLGPIFTLPLLLSLVIEPAGFSWKHLNPGTRFLMIVCAVTLAGEALPIWFLPHYAAPLTAAIFALVLIAMRRLRSWEWRHKPVGLFITRAVPSLCGLLLLLLAGTRISGWPANLNASPEMLTWASLTPSNTNRAAMIDKLKHYPGRQLVIVHYGPDHDLFFNEWVYNRADLDSAKIIWAHDMGPAENEKLIRYYKGRHAWLLYADEQPPRIKPYDTPGNSEARAGKVQGTSGWQGSDAPNR